MNMVQSRHMLFSDWDVFHNNREHSVKHFGHTGSFYTASNFYDFRTSVNHRDGDQQKEEHGADETNTNTQTPSICNCCYNEFVIKGHLLS